MADFVREGESLLERCGLDVKTSDDPPHPAVGCSRLMARAGESTAAFRHWIFLCLFLFN